MSKILFSKKDIRILEKNRNILRVSENSITYSYELKIIFIDAYISGKLPKQIFEEDEFDINIIGMKRIGYASQR